MKISLRNIKNDNEVLVYTWKLFNINRNSLSDSIIRIVEKLIRKNIKYRKMSIKKLTLEEREKRIKVTLMDKNKKLIHIFISENLNHLIMK